MNEIKKEVLSQLRKLMLSEKREIQWLENESKEVAVHSIKELANKAGFKTTAEMLKIEFYDYIQFIGSTEIKAKPTLYDSTELHHILSLNQRTKKPKAKIIRVQRYENGRKYQSKFNHYSSTTSKTTVIPDVDVEDAQDDKKRPTIKKTSVIMANINKHLSK